MEIGITTRAEPARIEAARRILHDAGLVDRTDFVKVVWSTHELEAAQERAWAVLSAGFPDKPLGAARDPETNSVELYVTEELTAHELNAVQAAVRAAGVSVRVEPAASYATPL